MKKILIALLSLSAILSVAGCKEEEKEQTQPTSEPNEVVVSTVEQEEETIVGKWVVEKSEAFDGPMKNQFQEMLKVYYYEGAEYEFTEDGEFKNPDGTLKTNYKVISDTQIEIDTITGEKSVYDYELDGDKLILYACYTGDFVGMGYPGAVCFNRK